MEGVEYRRDEHGTADYTSEGTTGLGVQGRVEYVDYEGPRGKYLSFEQYGGGRVGGGPRRARPDRRDDHLPGRRCLILRATLDTPFADARADALSFALGLPRTGRPRRPAGRARAA